MTEIKKLSNDVTYLDIVKTIAVIIMIIDHVGFYFMGDDSGWFRAIGRIGMPVWFFMVGYANGRDLPNRLLIGALILAVADLVLFQSVFAMSALVTIIFLRLIIDHVMDYITRTRYIFILCVILLTFATFAADLIVEYGTMALLFAIAGFMVRHKARVMELTFITSKDFYGYLIYVVGAFCVLQNARFGFTEIQFIVMSLLTCVVMYLLVTMKPMTFPQIKDIAVKKFLQYCGRNTLDIYVAHLVVFKVILFASFALK